MKVVINDCFGGFSLSPQAILKLFELGVLSGIPVAEYFSNDRGPDDVLGLKRSLSNWREYLKNPDQRHSLFLCVFNTDESQVITGDRQIQRDNDSLIRVVEELGEKANGVCARLKIVEIPDDVEWHIDDYDGLEHVAEDHRTWQ